MPNANTTTARTRRDSADLLDFARTQARLARVCREAGRNDEADAIVRAAQATAEGYCLTGRWA